MMDVELVPIGTLDRRSTIERRLDNLLKRYSKPEFQTFNAIATYAELLEAYLAVIRLRYKLRRKTENSHISSIEEQYLELITQDTQDELIRRVRLAKDHLLSGDGDKAVEVLKDLERDMPNLADGDQKHIASTKREPNRMNQILTSLLARNRQITHHQAIDALRDMKGDGVVLAIDREYVEIDETSPASLVQKIKTYKLSGIGANLSRIRNPKKNRI